MYTPVQILNGRAWVIVDGAVLDVSSFAKRHPGGARLIMNAMGTDVTSEIMGEEASIGNSNMAFAPHPHTDVSGSGCTSSTERGDGEGLIVIIMPGRSRRS